MFKGTSFSTGGYSAEYGQALSSALVLDSKDKAELTRTDIGLLSVGADVAHTHAWDDASVSSKFQYTNLRPYTSLIRQKTDWINPPVSLEGSSAFRQKVGDNGLLKLYANVNSTDFALNRHDIDDANVKTRMDLKNDYQYINASYKNIINETWNIRAGVSYTGLSNKNVQDSITASESTRGIHVKAMAEGALSDGLELKAGAEAVVNSINEGSRWLSGGNSHSLQEVMSSLFLEMDMYASNNFVLRIGGRAEHLYRTHDTSVDPRVSLAYKVGTHGQVSFAFGKFRQRSRNAFVIINPDLESEKADHYILNYQLVKGNRTLRVETYYKRYSDLVKFTIGNTQALSSTGIGYAKGLEVFWRDNSTITGLDYWISYSFLDTKRNYLDFPYEATPSFASKHNLSVVAKYFVRGLKSQLGVTYSLTSGRPYNNPTAESFNSLRTPNFADLSLNWSYLPTTSVIVYFSCTNVLGRDNIFGYEYGSVPLHDGTYNARPIRQASRRFLFLGVFITISKDKSVNQLPEL
jgi:outer membrane cobalamin receptor